MPNGVVVSYSFDNDSRLTGITYQFGSSTLGNLSYSYDSLGRRTLIGGSFARTGLPGNVSSTTYDAANELTYWNGISLSYDANGNMVSDGSNKLTWNARNQVTLLNNVSLQYDALGRRTKNVIGTAFLGTSEWYQNANDHRCPHDGWLENLIISEAPGKDKRRITAIRIRLLAAYHDGYIEFFYPDVFIYMLEKPFCSTGAADWLYDEFRLSDGGHVIHEIEWSSRRAAKCTRWIIEASDVQYKWIPEPVSISH